MRLASRQTGVHQHGLPFGRDEQRGLAAFGVDEIDVHRLRGLRRRGGRLRPQQRRGQQDCRAQREKNACHLAHAFTFPGAAPEANSRPTIRPW